MFLPIYLKVYLPQVATDHFEVEPEFFPEIKNILNRAWRDVNAWLFLPEKKSSNGFYNYHRAPQDMYGDNGYIRLASFLNLVLHSSWKGRTVYSLINTKYNDALVAKSLASFTPTEGYSIPSTLKDKKVSIDDKTKELIDWLIKLPAMNSFNAKLIKLEEIREKIDQFVGCDYIESSKIGATLFNLLLYYSQMMHLLWLCPLDFDENGKVKNGITVSYKSYDLSKIYLEEEFVDLFQHHVLSSSYTTLVKTIVDMSKFGVLNTYDMNGFHLMNEFFEKFTDKVFESALLLTQNLYLMKSLGRTFFDEVQKYSDLIRLKTLNAQLVPRDIKGGYEFLIFQKDIQPVNTASSEVDNFISHFEDEYSEMIDLWKQFVDFYYVRTSTLANKGKPSGVAYCCEINGVNIIYGLKMTSPYSTTGVFLQRFQDGDEFQQVLTTSPTSNHDNIIKSRIMDESKKGINISDLARQVPNYWRMYVRTLQSYHIVRQNANDDIYVIKPNDTAMLLVPPLNPVSDYKFDSSLMKKKYPSDKEIYLAYTVDIDALKLQDLPFIVNTADYSVAHNSSDPDEALDTLGLKTLRSAISIEKFGIDNFILITGLGRASVMSLSALIATKSTTTAEQAIRYLSIGLDFKGLNHLEQGVTIDIPRNMYVPFPYNTKDSSDEQIAQMRKNFKTAMFKPCPTMDDKHDLLCSEGVTIDLDKKYSIFTDVQCLGISSVKFGKNMFPRFIDFVEGSDTHWRFKVNSLVNKVDSAVLKIISLFNIRDIDFYDPYPNLGYEDSLLMLLTGVLSDVMLYSSLLQGVETDVNISKSCETVLGVYQSIKKELNGKGRVHLSANFDIDKTWSEILEYLKPTVDFIESLGDTVSSIDAVNFTKFTQLFTDGLKLFRDNHPIFWNKNGFVLQKLYFGNIERYLQDKFAGRVRTPIQEMGDLDIRYVSLPPVLTGLVSSTIRNHILTNIECCFYNLIGKMLYDSSVS